MAEAVRSFPNLRFVSEKDKGMYDAINRGWEKATGDILAWLNCDEQYLPGALEMAADYFRAHPETDILFADAIVVDADCAYVCSREVLTPHLYHTQTCHLQTFSCSMFLRRGLLERGFKLDPTWKDLGDAVFVLGLIRAKVRMASLGRFTSTFVDSGENMNLRPAGAEGAGHFQGAGASLGAFPYARLEAAAPPAPLEPRPLPTRSVRVRYLHALQPRSAGPHGSPASHVLLGGADEVGPERPPAHRLVVESAPAGISDFTNAGTARRMKSFNCASVCAWSRPGVSKPSVT